MLKVNPYDFSKIKQFERQNSRPTPACEKPESRQQYTTELG
jgi:hypothetical protein